MMTTQPNRNTTFKFSILHKCQSGITEAEVINY